MPKRKAPSRKRHALASGISPRPAKAEALPKKGSARSETSPAAVEGSGDGRAEQAPFCIVGIGASAGGLDAFQQVLAGLPVDTGMAFVLVSHLDPQRESLLTQILSRSTRMPAVEVTDRLRVEPDRVYVIPSNASMTISQGVLKIRPRSKLREPHHPIDHFLRSLAEDRGDRAIGVILSGLDGDGTRGLEAIKGEGGITFVQDDSAAYDSMPNSAVAAGVVDFVLPPAEIAAEISRIACHPYVASPRVAAAETPSPETGTSFEKILATLYRATGVDFSQYKPSTLERRIVRRMVINRMGEMEQYAAHLRKSPDEVADLCQDLLIGVTSFFRDPGAFEALETLVIPQILKARAPEEAIRVWVPGCSTGEEAYSIAMLLSEAIGDAETHVPVQLYGTDLNEVSIEKARAGFYPKAINRDVSPERLGRFFVESEGGYRVSKPVRDMCVFARHNTFVDPPFSRMSLVSCRNLLIYLEPTLQKTIIPALHYALRPNGFLMLGASETLSTFPDLFVPVDKKHRIYSKKLGSTRPGFHLARSIGGARSASDPKGAPSSERAANGFDAPREADRILLARYAPAAVLVDADLQIVQFRGSTGQYLEAASGKATHSVLKMAREGLLGPLRAAIQKAKKGNASVRREGVKIATDGGVVEITVEVVPITPPSQGERSFLIVFEPASGHVAPSRRQVPRGETSEGMPLSERVTELEQEVTATRDYMQSVIEQYEAANEELQATSEELQSTNEEMQSINEELETGKEELQSSNEELMTVNDELHAKNEELIRLNAELTRLEHERALLFKVADEARMAAQTANRTKDVFLATVSHELRTPLNAMLGWANILRAGPASEEVMARALETIERNAKVQARLIDDLMDISRIISGKLNLVPSLIDLRPVVEAAVEALRPAATAKGIALETITGPDECPVLGDADRLRQIVSNLTTNAIKFTPKGGRVEVRLVCEGAEARLTVSDTGRGLSAEALPQIFDQFRQVGGPSDSLNEGLGLGLAIVRSLVDLHGGTVRVESPGEGQGAVFTVTLPVEVDSREAAGATTAGGDIPGLDGVRILVVEDETDARAMLEVGLALYGAEVRASATAADALREMGRWIPHVLVADIGMADEDGYVLIAKVRALAPDQGGRVPAIALTAYVTPGDRRKAIATGFDMHWPKPVDLPALVAGIANLLKRGKPSR